MEPMFTPMMLPGKKRPVSGKYSIPEKRRIEIFNFVIQEIRKHSDCRIALCKESAAVWESVGLDLSKCRCACQLDYEDMSPKN